MNNNENEKRTTIQNFYAGKNILITGGTGFVGKILIEKLLRCCPELASLLIIIRPKKGQNVESRVKQLFNEPIFDQVKVNLPNFRKKVVAIEGDCALPDLGISSTDREFLSKEVSIVFHIAATIRFDEKLKQAIAINVNGTKQIIHLCKSMHNLQVFMHVSTLYSNCVRDEIDEKIYEAPKAGKDILQLSEILDEQELNDCEIILRKSFPNTYTYTKAIAEQVVQQHAKEIPTGIFRPGIITSSYKEPIPGWIDNLSGVTGVNVFCTSGLLRIVHSDESMIAELAPADFIVNALIVSAWDVASHKNLNSDPVIYNHCSPPNNKITWRNYSNMMLKNEIPASNCLWYTYLLTAKNYYLYSITSLVLQFLPAILIDTVLIAFGQKTWAIKTNQRIQKYVNLISYFTLRQWTFKNERIKSLWQKLSLDDQRIFFFTMENFDWNDYMKICMNGIRLHIMKDTPDTIPEAKRRRTILTIIHTVLKYTMIMFGIWIFYKLIMYFF